MSDIDVFGHELTAEQARKLHDKLTDGILMGLIEHMREQTKETLSLPSAEGPALYRMQGNAIILKTLLSLPEVVTDLVNNLPPGE